MYIVCKETHDGFSIASLKKMRQEILRLPKKCRHKMTDLSKALTRTAFIDRLLKQPGSAARLSKLNQVVAELDQLGLFSSAGLTFHRVCSDAAAIIIWQNSGTEFCASVQRGPSWFNSLTPPFGAQHSHSFLEGQVKSSSRWTRKHLPKWLSSFQAQITTFYWNYTYFAFGGCLLFPRCFSLWDSSQTVSGRLPAEAAAASSARSLPGAPREGMASQQTIYGEKKTSSNEFLLVVIYEYIWYVRVDVKLTYTFIYITYHYISLYVLRSTD